MADPARIESAVKRARDQRAFIQDLLIDALGWDIDERAEDIEEISFEWSADELRAEGLEKHLVDGTIRQIRPMAGNPWGIFILEFNRPDVFATGRGMTGPLRKVLRGLVPSKKKKSSLASFGRENLLFICNHDYQHYRFVHFKTPGQDTQTAPLAAFGWGPGDPIRTLCEYNLTALEWPDGSPDAQGWIDAWRQAFDVEKVTKRFYADYAAVFAKVETLIGKHNGLAGDDLRMFTQTLFNRLMFLRFIERKRWLAFDGHHDYLRALYAAGGYRGKSFYKGRLRPLFFEGMSIEGKQESEAYGRVPCLNGGLFEPTELDNRVPDLPDEVFERILADERAGGLFYRYNFTIEESTPLDIEVAVDPEMLGKVFEELVTGRHESGSYYTPRPVVSFMCREALKGYLTGKVANVVGTRRVPSSPSRRAPSKPTADPTATDPAKTDNPLHSAIATLVDQQDAGKLRETHAREIVAALDDLKAVDPACGSGAYLLGLLQEMVGLYRLLYSEKLVKDARSLYDLKLRIISQSLYGVDIDPFATNIAKLRLWLSLAVEADEPVPLPNLDFKIETGDSLLAPDPQQMPDLFRAQLQYSADVLAMVKRQFFLAHGEDKEEYRHTVMSEEARLRKELAAEHGDGIVDWRIQFAEVFANNRGGFDIAMMNPPYVATYSRRSEKASLAAADQLRNLYGNFGGRINLFTCFIVRMSQLLSQRGFGVFIVPDSYSTSDSYRKVRALYAERFPNETWVLVKPAVFLANVRNVIVCAGPAPTALKTIVLNTNDDVLRIGHVVAKARTTIWGIHHRANFFTSMFEQQLWVKVRSFANTVSSLFLTKDGVNPGPRHVRERLLDPCSVKADPSSIRPLIEGTQIDPKGYFVHPPLRTILYDPSLLTQAEKKAGASLRDPQVFESPKLVSRQTADTLIAAIDVSARLVALNSVHCTSSVSGSTEHLWGLLGLLNSPLARLFYAIDGGETRELLPQVHISWLREFPVPTSIEQLLSSIAPIVRRLHDERDD